MPTDVNSIDAQAGDWLARLDRPDATEEDRAEFERWRTTDPRHAAAYARIAAAWSQLDRVCALRPTTSRIDPNFLKPRSFAFNPTLAAVAAALVLAVIATWLLASSLSGTTYVTGIGGFQRIVLSDGSVLELNTDTGVRVSMDNSMRKIELRRGEASFEVAHDATRPFIVTAGNAAVRAIGTRFNVRRFERAVEVLVDEGRVAVGASEALARTEASLPPSTRIVEAGQAAIARAQHVTLSEIAPGVSERKLAWRERMLVFDGTPLSEAVAEFNRYNERHLVLSDPALATLKIGGYFRPTNVSAFIELLDQHFAVRAVWDTDRIALSAASGTTDPSHGP